MAEKGGAASLQQRRRRRRQQLQHPWEQRQRQQCLASAGGDLLPALLGSRLRRDAGGKENRGSSADPSSTLSCPSSAPWLKTAATSPRVAWLGRGLGAAAAAGRGAPQTPSPGDSGTPCLSPPVPAADCVPKTFAVDNRGTLSPRQLCCPDLPECSLREEGEVLRPPRKKRWESDWLVKRQGTEED